MDHVAVGPGGVLVISTKSWTGHVDVRGGVLRQNGYARHPVIETALGQAAAVAALIPASRRRVVRSMVCMTEQPELSGTTGSGVEVHGVDQLVSVIAGMPAVLDHDAVVEVYALLGQVLTQPQTPAVQDRAAVSGTRGRPIQGAAQAAPQLPHAAPGENRSGPRLPRGGRRAGHAGLAWVASALSAALLAPALQTAWELLSR
jgi:hypothetical protein